MAQRTIDFSWYTVDDEAVIYALGNAAQRGVIVRGILDHGQQTGTRVEYMILMHSLIAVHAHCTHLLHALAEGLVMTIKPQQDAAPAVHTLAAHALVEEL